MGRTAAALAVLCLGVLTARAQDLPEEAVQVNMNGYFDNYRVNIVYPSVALTKHVGEKTAGTGRYLVDVISAASMKSRFGVDAVTSASQRTGGVDEVRQEEGLGITRLLGRTSLSLNGLYSTEHDYTSRTLAGQVSMPFALKNTVVQLGAVRSWDRVFPDIHSWVRHKDVFTLSGGLTQVLGRRLIAQVDGSHSETSGYQADAYQQVTLLTDSSVTTVEPVHPELSIRRAVGPRLNYRLNDPSALSLGYRYYWDDWDVRSHTANWRYQRRLDSGIRLGVGMRVYTQTGAFFFEPRYAASQEFMTVDAKPNRGHSVEAQLEAIVPGDVFSRVPGLIILSTERTDQTLSLNLYRRHTASPDWHSRRTNLYAYVVSLGYRFRF